MISIHTNEHELLDEFSLALMETTLELREQDLEHYVQSMGSKEVGVHVYLLMEIRMVGTSQIKGLPCYHV